MLDLRVQFSTITEDGEIKVLWGTLTRPFKDDIFVIKGDDGKTYLRRYDPETIETVETEDSKPCSTCYSNHVQRSRFSTRPK